MSFPPALRWSYALLGVADPDQVSQERIEASGDADAVHLFHDPLEGLTEGGIVYYQSALPPAQIWESLPVKARRSIHARKLRLFALDAKKIARDTSSRADLQVRMQGIVLLGAFLRLSPFAATAGLDETALFSSLEKTLTK